MQRSFGKIFLTVLAMVAYAFSPVHERLRQDLFEYLFSFFFFFVFRDRASLCSPGCPGAHAIESGWPGTLKSASLCLQSTGTKGVHHH